MIVKVAWIFIHSIFFSSWSKVTDSVSWFNIGLCLLCTTFFLYSRVWTPLLHHPFQMKWPEMQASKQAKLNQWKLKKIVLDVFAEKKSKSKKSKWCRWPTYLVQDVSCLMSVSNWFLLPLSALLCLERKIEKRKTRVFLHFSISFWHN